MTEKTLNAVNEHCLDNVMKLAETNKVTTSEDIFDDHGNKLLAKGAAINPAMKERLMRHKLHKPLETSLTVENGIDNKNLVAEANTLLADQNALQVFIGKERETIIETLSNITIEPAATLLLTTAANNRTGSLRHSVLVTLIASSIAVHQKMEKRERLLLGAAALLHDVGEIYIDPIYLDNKRILTPHEWKHVIAHPRVAQLALSELTGYPKVVTEAVGNHHERIDGSGYPRQLSGTQLDQCSRILSLAETLSGILMHKEEPLLRSCLALKCIPGEYPRELVSLISNLRRNFQTAVQPIDEKIITSLSQTQDITQRLIESVEECQLIANGDPMPAAANALLAHTGKRIAELHQAMKASGINECIVDNSLLEATRENHEILMEIDVIGKEINWRMRDIARDLYIRLNNTAPECLPTCSKLIGILDNSYKP